MDMEAMYQEVILDHYRSPHGRGLREPFDTEVMHVNPTCGDEITLRVRLSDDPDPVVEDVSYWSQGCSISQASASVLFDEVVGQPLPQAFATLDALVELMHSKGEAEADEEILGDLVAFEGVAKFPARVKCALLAWMAFKDAVGQALEAESRIGQSHVAAAGPEVAHVSSDGEPDSIADPPRHQIQLDHPARPGSPAATTSEPTEAQSD